MKKIVWLTGDHMLIETPSKTFNKQVGAISVGNVYDTVEHSGYVRSWYDEGDNLFQAWSKGPAEPGRFCRWDLKGWENLPEYIYKQVVEMCKDREKHPNGIIFYEFHHWYHPVWNGRRRKAAKLVHGYVATTRHDEDFQLIKTWVTGPHHWISEGVIYECVKYITNESEEHNAN